MLSVGTGFWSREEADSGCRPERSGLVDVQVNRVRFDRAKLIKAGASAAQLRSADLGNDPIINRIRAVPDVTFSR